MKYGIIKVKRAFLYEENGVDVVDERGVFDMKGYVG